MRTKPPHNFPRSLFPTIAPLSILTIGGTCAGGEASGSLKTADPLVEGVAHPMGLENGLLNL